MWQLLAGGAAALALAAGTFFLGRDVGWTARDARAAHELNATLKADAAQLQLAQAAGFRIGAEYAGRSTEIRTRTETLTREVPRYVTPADDAAGRINVGFVRLHDAAAAGVDLGPAGPADAAPSGVALSAVARTVAGNYGTCLGWRQQVIGLQDLVTTLTGYPAIPAAATAP
jgi:hypothetical protein